MHVSSGGYTCLPTQHGLLSLFFTADVPTILTPCQSQTLQTITTQNCLPRFNGNNNPALI